ncbi:AMIN-like domain-containing (lipo)protein [Prescottella agglutinans]|uniref:AMIN-like domain-containing (lipo)protein n=1 Tax=Prescottella agglutinans TaxID=1644129 RepID=UPI003D99C3CA
MTHFRSRRTLAMSSVAVAALALAGCTSTESEPTASTTSMTSSAAVDSDSDSNRQPKALAAPAEGTLTAAPTGQAAPQTSAASPDAALTITDIRVGKHDGFDRVVYEFGGTGTPGWRAEIVSTATQQGSGNPLAVAGQGILQVLIDGSSMPFMTNVEPYAGPNPLEVENPVVVTEVRDAGIFEGTDQTLVGLSDRNVSYRVYTLTEPTRLVVDIAR